jgi:hypothetical protein
MSPPAQFSSVRLGCLGARNQTHDDTRGQKRSGDVRGAWNWNDVRTQRADPGDAQLCSGHVLSLRDGGQGIDDGKVVPHGLTTNGESQRHSILFHTESYVFLEPRKSAAEVALCTTSQFPSCSARPKVTRQEYLQVV